MMRGGRLRVQQEGHQMLQVAPGEEPELESPNIESEPEQENGNSSDTNGTTEDLSDDKDDVQKVAERYSTTPTHGSC